MKHIFTSLLILAILLMVSSAYAQDPGAKLLRGLVNTASGFLELPITVYRVSKAEGYPKGLTYGLGKGLVNGVCRTLAGVYEVVTFPIPVPAGYKAVCSPDTLLTPETLEEADPAMRSDFKPLGSNLSK